MLNQGLAMNAALELLRDSGASPGEAVDAVAAATGHDPAQATALVQQCGAWKVPRAGRAAARLAASATRGSVGQHGRSGHGASTVLPHLVQQALSTGEKRR